MSDIGKTRNSNCAQQPEPVVARVTIDTVFLLVHAPLAAEILRLLSSYHDQTHPICEILCIKELVCAAFIDTSRSDLNECVLIELNSRACRDSDMHVLKKRPLCDEHFYATFINTARLCVVRITPFNRKKIETNGWQSSFDVPLLTRTYQHTVSLFLRMCL